MSIAYVDTSCLVAVALEEPGWEDVRAELWQTTQIFSSNLLEAELRAACAREAVDLTQGILDPVSWVLPDRPLSAEIAEVLAVGYARGADLWHLAAALFLDEKRGEVSFLTLDLAQRALAQKLGFDVQDEP